MKAKIFFLFLLLLAFGLRLIGLTRYPAGFTADEAAQGYTAYSILKTGKDEWGARFPLNPRSFGDFKAPFYTYLTIPSIALFGLNEFAVRLPGAMLGSLAVIAVWLLAKKLFSDSRVAVASALLLAISPWHISLSRGAFEANLTVFFLPLAVYLFLLGLKKPKLMLVSAFIFGLNLFTYHSAKLFTPLVIFSLLFWKRKALEIKRVQLLSLVIFIIFALVSFVGFIDGGGRRAADIGLFSGGWQTVSEGRYFAREQGLPDLVSRWFNNKVTFLGGQFVKSYFSYLSPQFLFTSGAGEATYGMIPGRGALYLIEALFIISALYSLIKVKEKSPLYFLLAWIFLSPIPAALARGVGYHANRVAVMMPAIQIISAYGFIRLLEIIKEKRYQWLIFLTVVFSFLSFGQLYFFQGRKITAPKMSYGWNEAVPYIQSQAVAKVTISRSFSEPQAFVMFYAKLEPNKVQAQTISWLKYENEGKYFVDQLGNYSLFGYQFKNFSFPEDLEEKNVVLVGTENDFLVVGKLLAQKMQMGEIKEKIIYFPDGKVAIKIVVL